MFLQSMTKFWPYLHYESCHWLITTHTEGGSQQEEEIMDIKLHFFQMKVIYSVPRYISFSVYLALTYGRKLTAFTEACRNSQY